jgi:hypothetical protein
MSRNEPVPIPALLDPQKLTQANIDAAIKRKTPGVYVLGTLDADHVMTVSYVGRSDDDLAAKLRRHVGNYPAFAYALADTPLHAYQAECKLYHDLRPSKNVIHPVRQSGSEWVCLKCGL